MMKTLFLFLFLTFTGTAIAQANELPSTDESAQTGDIPTTETEFVQVIHNFDKSRIIQQFGQPSKQDDVVLSKDGKSTASIWQYHNLITNAEGTFYQTTELDFIDDNVVMVVFMNNDGEDIPDDAVQVPVPPVQDDL